MKDINRVTIIGRLTGDVELKMTPSGKEVANFRMAVNRHGDEADFINIITWGNCAVSCNKYLKKGSQIAVDGRIQTRNWSTPKGEKRYAVDVVADNVQFLDRKREEKEEKKNETSSFYGSVSAADFEDVSPEELLPF